MAVTPRTIFNNPAALAVGLVTCVGLAVVAADEFTDADCASKCPYAEKVAAADDVEELDVGAYLEYDQPEFQNDYQVRDADGPMPARSVSTADCDGAGHVEQWSEQRWMTYLDCLDRRGEHHEIILDETERGLAHLKRSLDLAVHKGELLDIHGTQAEHIAFLERALDRHDTPSDIRLEQMYVRALVWRGGRLDINRAYQTLRNRGPETMTEVAETCEGKQALAWMNYALINRSQTFGDEVEQWDVRADGALIDEYVASDCQERIHSGEWSTIAEIVGAGILAEQVNGHDGESTMIRTAVESFDIQNVPALCRYAVPAQTDLRAECEARVRFELEMTR
jgi:hypothetical protein